MVVSHPLTYREQEGWRLQLDKCRCDIDFLEYIATKEITGDYIFHMGPGLHHQVGLIAPRWGNFVLSVTLSPEEDDVYDKMLEKNWQDTIKAPYVCFYIDIAEFDPSQTSPFDYVNLFHLGEMLSAENSSPKFVIERFLKAQAKNLLFYTGSSAWNSIKALVENHGQLVYSEDFKSLRIYKNREFVN